MSTLSGQTIQSTYQGLLKLADSTTGITSNLQAIEDGLGNNTGLRITTNQLESPNIQSFVHLKAQYYGPGFQNSNTAQYAAGTQGIILGSWFQNAGNNSFSAITFNTTTITSTSDTVEFAIYTTQMINPFGLFPHAPIISGITADTTTLGLNTYIFPSHISFSGYGGGIYFILCKISNGGVQPTWRPGTIQGPITILQQSAQQYGITQQFATNTFSSNNIRGNNSVGNMLVFSGLTTFDNPYSNTINTAQSTSTTVGGNFGGFILHTVDA